MPHHAICDLVMGARKGLVAMGRKRTYMSWRTSIIEAAKRKAYLLGIPYSRYVENLVACDLASNDKPTILTVANPKWGTGKTTTATYLSIGLGACGKKVLLIDFDADADATILFFGLDALSFKVSVISACELVAAQNKKAAFVDVIRQTPFANVDIAPMDPSFIESGNFYFMGGEHQLALCIESVRGSYDFVVIDTPSGLGGLFQNAVVAQRMGGGQSCFIVPWREAEDKWKGLEIMSNHIAAATRYLSLPERPIMFLLDSDKVPPELLGKGRFRATMPKGSQSLKGELAIDEEMVSAWIPVAEEVAAGFNAM